MKNKTILLACFTIFYVFCPLLFAETSTAPSSSVQNILAINPEMFDSLNKQERLYQQKLLEQHPIIVALFSTSGGQFILYRPGKSPIFAKPIPDVENYQLATAVEHAAMETYAIAIQGLNDPKNSNWQTQMKAYQQKLDLAKQSIDSLTISSTLKEQYGAILMLSSSFITENLHQGSLSQFRTDEYAKKLEQYFIQVSKVVVFDQVSHWTNVVSDWKNLLGKDWNNTYGVILYVNAKRKNNIFLNILSNAMGQEAVDTRLFNFTADSYQPTTDQALRELAKTMPDKTLANQVFGEYFLAYSQILGKTAREIMGDKTSH